jgi:hypothetical protein
MVQQISTNRRKNRSIQVKYHIQEKNTIGFLVTIQFWEVKCSS